MSVCYILQYVTDSGPGQHSHYSNSLSARWSKYQNQVGWDFPHPSRLALGTTQPSLWVPGH